MPRLTGFPPIAGPDAHTLILGSMPGAASLAVKRYYAHPANAFWPIMAELLGFSAESLYIERTRALMKCGFALWDVLQHCDRAGSLDSAIRPDSEIPNNFSSFFEQHRALKRIVFNGAKAQQCFHRHIVTTRMPGIVLIGLPSTSPAHARMGRVEKLQRWRAGLGLDNKPAA